MGRPPCCSQNSITPHLNRGRLIAGPALPMNLKLTPTTLRFVLSLMALSAPLTLIAQPAAGSSTPVASNATGSINGRIYNPATKEYIRNAEIKIEGTQQATISEEGGY